MNIDYLNNIKKVEAPPFLYTRIKQKIENLNEEKLSKKTAWALSLSFLLIICLNIELIINNQINSQNTNQYSQAFNLTTNNNLYNE